jgi:hypothetical protein
MAEPVIPPPDDRDWTYVITEGCADCGFTPQPPETTGERIRTTIPLWNGVLAEPDARDRPAPTVWSVAEYGCHVRDACRIFRGRLERMLAEDDPVFDNWDQDQTAIQERYDLQDPVAVARELSAQAAAIAATFDSVQPDQWERPGRRSNGSVFTIATFSVYFLHDLDHHVWDVTRGR